MTQPTIITAQTKGYSSTGGSTATKTYEDVVVPAEANTLIVLLASSDFETSRTWINLTYGSALAVRTHLVDVSAIGNSPSTVVAIFDVSEAGAMTEDVVGTLSSSSSLSTVCGVICSTGFVESYSTSVERSTTTNQHRIFSPNYENNIAVTLSSLDEDLPSLSITNGTELFKYQDAGSTLNVGTFAISQSANNSQGGKLTSYTLASPEESATINILLSTQRNAFSTNFGPVIRPIISHDVIS
jgi:hypothetical protein